MKYFRSNRSHDDSLQRSEAHGRVENRETATSPGAMALRPPPKLAGYALQGHAVLAPMAGVTDQPFRGACLQHGAAMVTTEMVSANILIRQQDRHQAHNTALRLKRSAAEAGLPHIVQIAGGDATDMAQAARINVELGADIIDINMGCPAKKVCKKAAGSALMRDLKLVEDIVSAVVAAVDVPVTLKCRTGWDTDHRNAVELAKIVEAEGIQSLVVHGRSRACRYQGEAEFDTIAAVKQAVGIPVFANGDITNIDKAAEVLRYTDADGLMVGRGAQGNPWLFGQINHFLATGERLAPAQSHEIGEVALGHLKELHAFYGELPGLRIARKHIGWYLAAFADGEQFRRKFNGLNCANSQLEALLSYFENEPRLRDHADTTIVGNQQEVIAA